MDKNKKRKRVRRDQPKRNLASQIGTLRNVLRKLSGKGTRVVCTLSHSQHGMYFTYTGSEEDARMLTNGKLCKRDLIQCASDAVKGGDQIIDLYELEQTYKAEQERILEERTQLLQRIKKMDQRKRSQ